MSRLWCCMSVNTWWSSEIGASVVACHITSPNMGNIYLSGRCIVGIWMLAISQSAANPWPARLVSRRDGFSFVTDHSVHRLAARLWSLCHRRFTLAAILLLRCFDDLCTLCDLYRFPYYAYCPLFNSVPHTFQLIIYFSKNRCKKIAQSVNVKKLYTIL